ncbi:hypothetical protein BROUX41_000725 [Berkeleyomyces rouxiae]|uniref:uncharacterized protein n=1 Tax=Berkeleyomyces rouxiae TaxID=2035830 RepID=UPI003B7770AB
MAPRPRARSTSTSSTSAPVSAMVPPQVYSPAPAKMEQTVFPTRRKAIRTYGKGKASGSSCTLKQTTLVAAPKTLKQQTLTQFNCLQGDPYEFVGTSQESGNGTDETGSATAVPQVTATQNSRVHWGDDVVGGEDEDEFQMLVSTARKRRKTEKPGLAASKTTTPVQTSSGSLDYLPTHTPLTPGLISKPKKSSKGNPHGSRKSHLPQLTALPSSFSTQTLTQLLPKSFVSRVVDHEVEDSEEEYSDGSSHTPMQPAKNTVSQEVCDSEDDDMDFDMLSATSKDQDQPDFLTSTLALSSPTKGLSRPRLPSPPGGATLHGATQSHSSARQSPSETPETPKKGRQMEIPSSQPSPFTPATTRYHKIPESPSPLRSRSTNSGILSIQRGSAPQLFSTAKVSRFSSSVMIKDSFAAGTSESETLTSPVPGSSPPASDTRMSPHPPSLSSAVAKRESERNNPSPQTAEVPVSQGGSLCHERQRKVLEDDIETQDGSDEDGDTTVIPDSEDEGNLPVPNTLAIDLFDSESSLPEEVHIVSDSCSPIDKETQIGSAPSLLQPPIKRPPSSSLGSPSILSIVTSSASQEKVVQDSDDESSLSDIQSEERDDMTIIPASIGSPELPVTASATVTIEQTGTEIQDQKEKKKVFDSLETNSLIHTQEDNYNLGAETQAIMHMLASDHTTMLGPAQPSILPDLNKSTKPKTRKRAMFATSSPEIMPTRYYTPTPSFSRETTDANLHANTTSSPSQPQATQTDAYATESQRVPLNVIQAMQHPTNRTDIFISIHPEHVLRIADGSKNHEFRKYQIHHEVVRMWIYTTKPESQVRYLACIGSAKQPGEVHDALGVGNTEFNSGSMTGVKFAYEILEVYELNNPQTLATLKDKGWLETPPQKYTFMPPAVAAQLLANLRCRIHPHPEEESIEDQDIYQLPTVKASNPDQHYEPQQNSGNSSDLSSLILTGEDIDRGLHQSTCTQDNFTDSHKTSGTTTHTPLSDVKLELAPDKPTEAPPVKRQFKRPELPSWCRPAGWIPDVQAFSVTNLDSTSNRAHGDIPSGAVATGLGIDTGISFSQASTASQSSPLSSPQLGVSPARFRSRSKTKRGDVSRSNITQNAGSNSHDSSNALTQIPPPQLFSSSQPVFNEVESSPVLLGTRSPLVREHKPGSGLASLGLSQLFPGGDFALPHSLIEDQEPPPVISDSEDGGL